ncbi:phage baseplate assembly protein V [Sphingomonas sp. 8AM]|uniref:phage baseplate assembly protein V n=1 Tax=Sphingomonas sp. 8AM TaxID=2653170 RepID=UPI0012F02136|nr:phage baseplate assembly protein V [Sphingomonas sp. 8AM]VXC79849.1 Phage baseplate assembly protein V [Sphingomonas sp. 8AM]
MTAISDPRRLAGNLIQLGTIDHVDLAAATCRVRVGEIETGDLPWLAARAGTTRIWSAPSVGEQCLLLCPEGDMEGGIVLPGLFSDANPAPATAALDLIRFSDGAELSYDAAGAGLKLTLPGGRPLTIVAPAGISLNGPVKVDGKLDCTDTITAATDVVGGGKSLKDHIHTKVQAGGAVSGPPQ